MSLRPLPFRGTQGRRITEGSFTGNGDAVCYTAYPEKGMLERVGSRGGVDKFPVTKGGMLVAFGALGLIISFYFNWVRKEPRIALISGLSFVAFSGWALPFHLFPLPGIASSIFYLIVTTVFIYTLIFVGSFSRSAFNVYNIALVSLAILQSGFLMFTPDLHYGIHKTQFYILKSLMPAFAFALMSPIGIEELRYVFRALVFGSVAATASVFLFGKIRPDLRGLELPGLSVLNHGYIVGYGVLILILTLLLASQSKRKTLSTSILVLLLTTGWFAGGSRGPVLGVVVGVLGIILLERRYRTLMRFLPRLAVIGVILSLLLVGSFQFDFQMPGFERVSSYILSFGQDKSEVPRLSRGMVALEGFTQSPIVGVGTGGFTHLWFEGSSNGEVDYPHNLFLEFAAEFGLIGLGLLIAMLVATLGKCRQLLRQPGVEVRLLVGLWLYGFARSMVSGDISSNHAFWIAGALIWCMGSKSRANNVDAQSLNYDAKGRLAEDFTLSDAH